MKIYVVTTGCYSDYSIVGVCSTLEKANELKLLKNADNDIEEYNVDEFPERPKGMYPFHVKMDRDGNSDPEKECCDFMHLSPRPYGDDVNMSLKLKSNVK